MRRAAHVTPQHRNHSPPLPFFPRDAGPDDNARCACMCARTALDPGFCTPLYFRTDSDRTRAARCRTCDARMTRSPGEVQEGAHMENGHNVFEKLIKDDRAAHE